MTEQQEKNVLYRYDRQTLYKTTTIALTDNEKDIGTRKLIDEYNAAGQAGLRKTLNAQKNEFERNIKNLKDKLAELESVEVDEEFLKKLSGVKAQQDKQQALQQLKANEDALKDVNWELREVERVTL